jgi:hypothetical protein
MKILQKVLRGMLLLGVVVTLGFGGAAALSTSGSTAQECVGCAGQADPDGWCEECCDAIGSFCHRPSDTCLCAR